jgi:hypothetical protein
MAGAAQKKELFDVLRASAHLDRRRFAQEIVAACCAAPLDGLRRKRTARANAASVSRIYFFGRLGQGW